MSKENYIQTLQEIRTMMDSSSRFLSLSGMSGVFAGIYAIISAGIAYKVLGGLEHYERMSDHRGFFLLLGIGTLVASICTAFLFTQNKARKKGVAIWDDTVKKAMVQLSIPLVAGGLFCLSLMYNGIYGYLAPATLIFYGLALVSVSRYTFPFIKQLGFMEIFLGLLNSFMIGYGLVFWIIGFGLLHICYGIYMYIKYDTK